MVGMVLVEFLIAIDLHNKITRPSALIVEEHSIQGFAYH